MNGPEHYAKAEEYLAHIKPGGNREDAAALAAAAQAHATLALAAATVDVAEIDSSEGLDAAVKTAWGKAVQKS